MRLRLLCLGSAFFAVVGCGSGGSSGSSSSGLTANGAVEETARIEDSGDPEWWVSSGALFFRHGSAGSTNRGALSPDSPWYQRYAQSNPSDSDGGAHPQNVFRVVHRAAFTDSFEDLSFHVERTNLSASGDRNSSNGVFLFQRYLGENDLYASGVRVDGNAVIKKKRAGRNYTLAIAPVFSNGGPWDRNGNPNVLPQGRSIGIRTEALDDPTGVRLRLFVNGGLALEVVDDGRIGGGPIEGSGLGGMRSDFMDVDFHSYRTGPL